ncbi:DUF6301 family protein [Nocardia tengchongensis]|uniref:DUF6301 family protein n=1 Tax=Nocardia tengchongensis TaxID=2055889 RepID=UPI0036C2F853
MQADVAGALRTARLAAKFDWSWTDRDLDRFCSAAGWTPQKSDTGSAFLQTSLDVVKARAYARLNDGWLSSISKSGLLLISVPVAGLPTGSGAGWFESSGDAFAAIATQLMGLLGNPDRHTAGSVPALTWLGLRNLVVSLEVDSEEIVLRFRNPVYQEWLDDAEEAEADTDDEDYEDDVDDDEQQDEEDTPRVRTAQLAPTSWGHLSEGLAAALSRMPIHQVITFKASGGRFVQFEYVQSAKRGVELRCHVAPNVEIDDRFRMSADDESRLEASGWARPRKADDNWQRSVSWPATAADYERAAEAAVSILRDLLHVAEPLELQVEAWIDWSSKAPDLSSLDLLTE